ncbi:PEGA domain-containing protein [Flavobacterium sp.]|uniref:PEGA domain-containing protein n=1 Tax=Flavobacterium sp. TaxID=239 RepID=UPI00286EEB4C|nr:PEGA domain-containing protein [Flavobacterium sp.]
MRKTIISSTLAIALLTSSCATIISGSKQNVKFDSNPSTATIYIDEVEVGKTPFEIKLARKSEHSVMIKLDGYQTYETKLTKKFNAWYIGNILFGGLIGVIIDPITGAIYNLTPDQINAQMNKGTAFKNNGKDVYVAVALKIDPNWKKIGQLEKI